MKILTDHDAMHAAMKRFDPDSHGAFPTGRSLEDRSEWGERGTINEKPAVVYWTFARGTEEIDETASLPFDQEPDRVEVEE